jgi:hypothetical protein
MVDREFRQNAAARGLTVATRDTQPYKAMGVDVINPWESE